jgi:asparagine synthase (glutamine-hydrolysing)
VRSAGGTPAAGSWLVEVRPEEGSRQRIPFRISADPTAVAATSTGQSCTLVFEGRLYNRADLEFLAGPKSSASDDAELLRCAFERGGEAVVRRMKGIFALVMWDARSRTLLAARDPMGVIPLFYASAGETLLLSPSIEMLLRQPGVPRAPNRLTLAAHLLELWPQSGETLREAVRRVPAGHLMLWRGAKCELSRYWDPEERPADGVPEGPEETMERFDQLLGQALDRCLQWGPAGIFLSGGLDSGTVAAAAAERARASGLSAPWALSLVYPHSSLNEERMQRRIATVLGLPQVVLPFDGAIGSGGLLLASLEAARHSAAPPLNLWRPAYNTLLGEGAQRGCRVILTGEGGDEWLMPPHLYAADRLAALDIPGLYRVWWARRRSTPFSRWATFRDVLWAWAARPLLRQAAGAGLHTWSSSAVRSHRLRSVFDSIPSWLAPHRDLRRRLVELAVDELPVPAPQALYEQSKRRLASHARRGVLMEEWFEDGRRWGVRVLEPLLDPDLAEFLYHVPPRVLIRGGQPKWLARATLTRRLPSLVRDWPKPVFADTFWLSVIAAEGPVAWRRLGGVPRLAELGVVDPNEFAFAVENAFSSGNFFKTTQVWSAWMLEVWLRADETPMIPGQRR